jgi:superfamily II helicase
MNKQLTVNEQEAKNVAKKTIKELTELQNELLPTRAFLAQACKHCISTIEDSDYTALKKVIVSYQQYGRAVVAQFIKQDKPNIEKILEQAKKTIDGHLKIMNECAGTVKLLLNNENPYLKEGIDKDVTDMDVAMAVTDSALGSINECTLACAIAKNMSGDLLAICALYNKLFYNTLHQALKDNETMFPVYLMFDEDGLIEEDDRNEELPLLGDKLAPNKKHLKS